MFFCETPSSLLCESHRWHDLHAGICPTLLAWLPVLVVSGCDIKPHLLVVVVAVL